MRTLSVFNIVFCLIFLFTGGIPAPVQGQEQNTELQWYSMKEAQQMAGGDEKSLLIFAEAAWCVYCKQMDRELFNDPEITDIIREYFYPVRVNIESDRPLVFNGTWMTEAQFANKFDLHIPPKTLILNSQGEELFSYAGFIPEVTFRKILTLWQEEYDR